MFNLRSGGQGNPSPAQPPTIEAIRRRARHRLIGASVLVLAGVIGFPLLFDTQPRPIAVDIPIDIPAKHTAPPLVVAPVAPAAQVQVAGVTEREEVLPTAPTPVPSAPVAATAPVPVPEPPRPAAAPTLAPAPTKAPEPPAKPAAAPVPSDAARAQALLDGKPPAPPAVRTVVQVGAFAEQARAQEVRQKLERAGLKTYTHVADTPEGKRIRVRLGPFASRAEAEAAATKVKALGLPAAVLTL